MDNAYDAVLVVSFGGPEGPKDVIPFLENVLRGKTVPPERLAEVEEHYLQFGGVSPLSGQMRELVAALETELEQHGPSLPVYWGNRNWDPFLSDTLSRMADEGKSRALAFFTSPFSSYSSCRQYLEDISLARGEVGQRAPVVEKLRAYFNHPGFVDPMAQLVSGALGKIPNGRRPEATVLFTAHSIPVSMAAGCAYEPQLLEASRLVAQAAGAGRWRLVYQSRSGPPGQPWLVPDVCDAIREIARDKPNTDIVVAPVGFISDHMEVIYDLDTEARDVAESLGVNLIRASTVGTHPRFVQMIRELIVERLDPDSPRLTLGHDGPSHDVCSENCCLKG